VRPRGADREGMEFDRKVWVGGTERLVHVVPLLDLLLLLEPGLPAWQRLAENWSCFRIT
jgi:hypothetical protein